MQNNDRKNSLEQLEEIVETVEGFHERAAKNAFETINSLDGISNLVHSGIHNVENLSFKLQALNQAMQDANRSLELTMKLVCDRNEVLEQVCRAQRSFMTVADILQYGERITEDNAALFQKIIDAVNIANDTAHKAEAMVAEQIEADEKLFREQLLIRRQEMLSAAQLPSVPRADAGLYTEGAEPPESVE